jgi:hypothetical protein
MDVAVKVIQHDASALEAVENEVQLQMYLNHPNIVSGCRLVRMLHQRVAAAHSLPVASTGAAG